MGLGLGVIKISFISSTESVISKVSQSSTIKLNKLELLSETQFMCIYAESDDFGGHPKFMLLPSVKRK